MAEQMTLAVSVEKQVGAAKKLDYDFSKVVDVDGNYVIETILEAQVVDIEFDLFISTLINEVQFVVIESDKPLTVKLDDALNTAIDMVDLMLLTAAPALLFISVPGTEDATVKIIYGGIQT